MVAPRLPDLLGNWWKHETCSLMTKMNIPWSGSFRNYWQLAWKSPRSLRTDLHIYSWSTFPGSKRSFTRVNLFSRDDLQTRCRFKLQLFVYFDPRVLGMIWDDVPHLGCIKTCTSRATYQLMQDFSTSTVSCHFPNHLTLNCFILCRCWYSWDPCMVYLPTFGWFLW